MVVSWRVGQISRLALVSCVVGCCFGSKMEEVKEGKEGEELGVEVAWEVETKKRNLETSLFPKFVFYLPTTKPITRKTTTKTIITTKNNNNIII